MKRKVLDRKLLPPKLNSPIAPFLVYMLIDYWSLPIWVFAIYMTLWFIVFIAQAYSIGWGTEEVTPKEFQ